MNKIEHFPINWTKGVKLNDKHFFESYYNTVESLKNVNSARLNSFNYGLGEKPEGKNEGVETEVIRQSDNSIIVRLKSCNALTRNGYSILYHDGLYGENIPTATINTSDFAALNNPRFYIVISVNPYSAVPVGIPDPDVIPLHHPYTLPKIQLYVLPESQINSSFMGDNFLIVGQATMQDNILSLSQDYIPPVQRICYSERLDKFRQNLIQSLQNIKGYSLLVYRKNRTNARKNNLADNTFSLCGDIHHFYSQYIFYLENIISEEPPVCLAQTVSVLANYLSVSLNTMLEKDRESLLQYYYEWSDIKPSDFTRSIGNIISLRYNHMNINQSVLVMSEFIAMLEQLIKKMSELEYIGLMRENIVVGVESEMPKQSKGDKRWSIFD